MLRVRKAVSRRITRGAVGKRSLRELQKLSKEAQRTEVVFVF